MHSNHSHDTHDPQRAVETIDFPAGRVHVAGPVGAVVTDSGLTFAVNLLHPEQACYRLRCLSCTWTATAQGSAELTRTAAAHVRDHDNQLSPSDHDDCEAQEVQA